MSFPKPHNNVEREALTAAFQRLRDDWGFAKSFRPSMLLDKWNKFVQEAEKGYQLSIYDFTHDLEMRDFLEEVKDSVPPRLRQEIEAVLHPLDERYYRATEPSDRPIEVGVENDARAWWFRIPKQAGPDVEQYFREKGFRGRRR